MSFQLKRLAFVRYSFSLIRIVTARSRSASGN